MVGRSLVSWFAKHEPLVVSPSAPSSPLTLGVHTLSSPLYHRVLRVKEGKALDLDRSPGYQVPISVFPSARMARTLQRALRLPPRSATGWSVSCTDLITF